MLPSVLAHHSEPGDPTLLEWIQDQIDGILGLGPDVIVIALGLLIVAIPAAIVGLFVVQSMRHRRR